MPRVENDIRIPVRDGRWLAADLHVPEGDGPFPAILVQTPYGKETLGAALPHPTARSWLDFWERERYALLISDWRGFFGSLDAGGGAAVSHRGTDGFDLVEWLAAQEWCDGNVAGWGPSALGRALLRTAAESPPHLRCGVPQVCHMGHFYEDLYEGGVLEESHLESVETLGFGMVDQIRAHPLSGSDFWRRGEKESRPEDLTIPLLVVTGWYDLITAQTIRFFDDLRTRGWDAARRDSRLLIGPWHHTAIDHRRQGRLIFPAAEGIASATTRDFLARHLEGAAETWPAETPIRYFQMGEERWIDSPVWPPPGLGSAVFHLGADGEMVSSGEARAGERTLLSDPENPVPTVGGANLPLTMKAGPYDQREVEAREDVLVYTTQALTEPVALTGAAEVTLTARTDAVDFDFSVRLTDVHPDGRSMLVADSIRRARLRGTTDLPMPLTPGAEYEVTVRLPPVAQTFGEGHRIRVAIAGSNWPRYERNGHNGLDHYDPGDSVPATSILRHGGDARSVLDMPVRVG